MALALLVFGVAMARIEAAPYFWGSGTRDTQFETLRSTQVGLPASIEGTQLSTNICLSALTGLRAMFRAEDARSMVRSQCLELMDEVVHAMPSDSYAWYAGALMQFQAGNIEEANRWLSMSQSTGPTEQWIAEVRVALAEDNFENLTPEVKAQHLDDLAILAGSSRGVTTIARRFVADPAFRERITSVVEQLSPEIQEQFLHDVRKSSQGRG